LRYLPLQSGSFTIDYGNRVVARLFHHLDTVDLLKSKTLDVLGQRRRLSILAPGISSTMRLAD
jgi:hypothetical protein